MLRGQGGVEKSESDGISYLTKAAKKGHPGAVAALGWHYLMKKDYKNAHKYLHIAAQQS